MAQKSATPIDNILTMSAKVSQVIKQILFQNISHNSLSSKYSRSMISPKNDLQTDLRDFKYFSLDAFERDINGLDWSFDTDLSLITFFSTCL